MFDPDLGVLMTIFGIMFVPSLIINAISWVFVVAYMNTKELRIKKLLEDVKREIKDWSKE